MAYEWVGDPKIRDAAYFALSAIKKGPTEEEVKEKYIELGGNVLEEDHKPTLKEFKTILRKVAKKK